MLMFPLLKLPCSYLVCLPVGSKGVSRLLIANPMPDNGSNRAGIVSPDTLWDHCFQLAGGHLFHLCLGEQRFLISIRALWRRPLFLSADRTTDEVKGLTKETQALCNFMRAFFMGFCLSCIVLHVAISRWESQGEMLIQCFYIGETAC